MVCCSCCQPRLDTTGGPARPATLTLCSARQLSDTLRLSDCQGGHLTPHTSHHLAGPGAEQYRDDHQIALTSPHLMLDKTSIRQWEVRGVAGVHLVVTPGTTHYTPALGQALFQWGVTIHQAYTGFIDFHI